MSTRRTPVFGVDRMPQEALDRLGRRQFVWNDDCGQHCGARHGHRLTHCTTCHQLVRVHRAQQ